MKKKKEDSYGLNTKLFKMLDELEKEGKIRSIPQEKANAAFKSIKEDLGYYEPKATLRVRTIPKRNIK